MPFSQLWAVMFFLMLITVGFDTEFGMLEGVVTPVVDLKLFPKLKKEHISGTLRPSNTGNILVQLMAQHCYIAS